MTTTDVTKSSRSKAHALQGTFIFLNVSGMRFCLAKKSLSKFPQSRLGQQFVRAEAAQDVEYFYDRNPFVFAHIVDFYRTGKMHFPHYLCWDIVADEMDYWQIDETYLADCCQVVSNDQQTKIKELKELQHVFGDDSRKNWATRLTEGASIREQLAMWYRDPSQATSRTATIYFRIFILTVLINLFSYIFAAEDNFRELVSPSESCPAYLVLPNATDVNATAGVMNTADQLTTLSTTPRQATTPPTGTVIKGEATVVGVDELEYKYAKYFISKPKLAFTVVDSCCIVVFVVDLFLRLV